MNNTEFWPVNRFIEYENNPRKNDHAVDRVANAIKEFGFRVPIIAKSDGLIIDGHLRLKAAKKLNLQEVPVLIADDMTETQIKAFRISVNKVAELADWDFDLLRLELESIQSDFDLDILGFTNEELSAMLGAEFEPASDDDQGKLDQLDPKWVCCPKCGSEFDARQS
jgi:ParB-like chromosome segregation protein Spo0J